jgi:hypothetical protein
MASPAGKLGLASASWSLLLLLFGMLGCCSESTPLCVLGGDSPVCVRAQGSAPAFLRLGNSNFIRCGPSGTTPPPPTSTTPTIRTAHPSVYDAVLCQLPACSTFELQGLHEEKWTKYSPESAHSCASCHADGPVLRPWLSFQLPSVPDAPFQDPDPETC